MKLPWQSDSDEDKLNERLAEAQPPMQPARGGRELVVAVFCLKQPFDEALERLSKMQYQPKPLKQFNRHSAGYANESPSGAMAAAQTAQLVPTSTGA
jgi:hypothetical protein